MDPLKNIINRITEAGIKIKKVTPGDPVQNTDPKIEISDCLHIQAGIFYNRLSYLSIVEVQKNGCLKFTDINGILALIEGLKERIK